MTPDTGGSGGALEDPLWQETQNVEAEFKAHGYRTATALAGKTAPNGGAAGTFAEMMAGLAADIAAQTAFCRCADDQLVIWLSAHGCRPSTNPTGDYALAYEPVSDKPEDVTWQSFLDALAAIPALAATPQKVFLIVESCWSGRAFEPAVAPGPLRGLHLFTGANASTQKCGALQFSEYVRFALGRYKAANWDHLVRLVKWQAATGGSLGTPKSGDIDGCRLTMTLARIVYDGSDIGDEWEFTIAAAGATTAIAEHVLGNGGSETPGKVVYDRVFGPCPSPVSFSARCDATCTTGLNRSGSTTVAVARRCDGTAGTLSVPVSVVTSFSGTAALTFSFDLTSAC
jgi:hypothetical protein